MKAGRTRMMAVAAAWTVMLGVQPGPTQAQAPTDAEIAHIAVTANQLDVDLAKEAKSKASDPEVRRFAGTMISDHTAVIGQAAALAKELGVTPADNEVSRSLRQGAEAVSSKLHGLDGAAFDRAYMDREVAYHTAVIAAVKDTLIPGARNARLRGLLEKVVPVLEGHLRMAEDIRAKLK